MAFSQIQPSPLKRVEFSLDETHFSDRWTNRFPKEIAERIYLNLTSSDQNTFKRVCAIWNAFGKKIDNNLESLTKDCPKEILGDIYSKLLSADRKNFKLVCDRWNRSANSVQDKLRNFSYPNSSYEISNHFPLLTELEFEPCGSFGDEKMADIGKLLRLELLRLTSAKSLSCTGLANLLGLTKLKILQLESSSKIDDLSLKNLKNLHLLQSLTLDNCSEIFGSGLTNLSKLEHLKVLSLSNCSASSDDGLKYISSLKKLRFVFLSESHDNNSIYKITKIGLIHLRQLHDLVALQLKNCRELTTGVVEQLTPLNHLALLSLSGCQNLSQNELMNAIASLNIAILDLSHCQVKKLHLDLRKRLPYSTLVEVTGCQLENCDLTEYTNIAAAKHKNIGESLVSDSFNIFSTRLCFYSTEGLAQLKEFQALNSPISGEEMDDQIFGLLLACVGFLTIPIADLNKPVHNEESLTFSMRIWRAMCWALKEFNRLILLALHLLGF